MYHESDVPVNPSSTKPLRFMDVIWSVGLSYGMWRDWISELTCISCPIKDSSDVWMGVPLGWWWAVAGR